MKSLPMKSIPMKCAIFALAFVLALPFTHCNAQDPNSAGVKNWDSGTHKVVVDGLERTFILDLPRQLKPGAALVLVFHGFTSSAEQIRNESGFASLAEQHGFVVVYPQGSRDDKGRSFFNVGYAFHADSKVDDLRFVKTVVDQLVNDLKLDHRSVFSTGMSNGGDMSFYLASQPKPIVTAVAPIAGTMMSSWGKDFVPQLRTSITAVHGTKDDVTLWDGDPENRDGWGAYLGVETVVKLWSKGLALELVEVIEAKDETPPRNRLSQMFVCCTW